MTKLFEVVNNGRQRVVAEGNGVWFDNVRVETLRRRKWTEEILWDAAEWREAGSAAFEAILGCIAKVAEGQPVKRPL